MTRNSDLKANSITYANAGVDIEAGNALVERIKPACASTKRSGAMDNIGGFGGLFDLKATGYKDPILVAATDGVGTKLKLAIETGLHHTIGIDLVAMCVNDLIVQGAEPLFFLDYYACGMLDQTVAAHVIEGIAAGCGEAGCALIGGETAEMPGMYQPEDYDLAGFCVGAAERSQLLPRQDISSGNVIIGLASSGVHANGFSLVRHLLELNELNLGDPLPTEAGGDGKRNIGEALLTPTKIYVKPCLKAIKETGSIKALAHITGGGLTENLPRILPKKNNIAQIQQNSWEQPLLFQWLQQLGNITEAEMLKTFNCGIGMTLICDQKEASQITNLLKDEGEEAFIIGEITETKHDVTSKVEYVS